MARDVLDLPMEEPRRRDRAVADEAWIRRALHGASYGVLATVYDGQPFVNPNLFVYHEASDVIYLHTARTGRTRTNVERDDRVCFTVSEIGRMLPADEALEFSVEYAAVVVFGRGSVVRVAEEAERALQLLLDKYCPHLEPGRDYRPITSAELRRTSVYRIDVDRWSAKRKVADPEFEGAFRYRAPSLLEAEPAD